LNALVEHPVETKSKYPYNQEELEEVENVDDSDLIASGGKLLELKEHD